MAVKREDYRLLFTRDGQAVVVCLDHVASAPMPERDAAAFIEYHMKERKAAYTPEWYKTIPGWTGGL